MSENLVSGILTANSAAYIKQDKYNPFTAHSTAEWINLNKVYRNKWGTLSTSLPAQELYHDTDKRIILNQRLKPMLDSEKFSPSTKTDIDLINSVQLSSDKNILNITFSPVFRNRGCIVYIHGKNNGVPISLSSCENWKISQRELNRLLRKVGYSINNAHIAIWQGGHKNLIASKSYNLNKLLQKNNIDIRKLKHD
jgi:hypothetical protein